MNTEKKKTKSTAELHALSARCTEDHLSFHGNQKLKTSVPHKVTWSLQLGN